MAGRIAISVLLTMTIALRPLHFDALLLHDHGDDGQHAHAVTLSSGESLESRHLRFHDYEHHDPEPAGAAAQLVSTGEHDEDCAAIVINFGDVHFARKLVRAVTDVAAQALTEVFAAPALCACAILPSAKPVFPRLFVSMGSHRAPDDILSTSSALLI